MHSFAPFSWNFSLKIAEHFPVFLQKITNFARILMNVQCLLNLDQNCSEFFQNATTFRSFPKPSEAFTPHQRIGTSSVGCRMCPDASFLASSSAQLGLPLSATSTPCRVLNDTRRSKAMRSSSNVSFPDSTCQSTWIRWKQT